MPRRIDLRQATAVAILAAPAVLDELSCTIRVDRD